MNTFKFSVPVPVQHSGTLDTKGYTLEYPCRGGRVEEFGFGDPISLRDVPMTMDLVASVQHGESVKTVEGFRLADPADAFAVFRGANRPEGYREDWQLPGVFSRFSSQFFLCPGVLGWKEIPQQRREEVADPVLDKNGRQVMYVEAGKLKPQMRRRTQVTQLPPLRVRAFMFLYLLPGVPADPDDPSYHGPRLVCYDWWPIGEGSFPGPKTALLYVR